MIAYIALGTNMGDREANLRDALRRLAEFGQVTQVASLWETEPVGYANQAEFLNTAVGFRTALPPLDLLGRLKKIERAMGRVESFRNAPRPIDLDILLYSNDVFDDPRLTIPHPRLHERRFVLQPLVEIAGDVVHPVLEKPIRRLLVESADMSWIRQYAPPGWETDEGATPPV
jgi:2-amino-4-hydroxy-6-hydroxymethyldihydropteridine diphosphokinase